jgi:hypothetical protein
MCTFLPREIVLLCFHLWSKMNYHVPWLYIDGVTAAVISSLIGQSGVYMMLSITSINVSWFYCIVFSCTVPLPSAVRPPAVPFRVVFCIGVVGL